MCVHGTKCTFPRLKCRRGRPTSHLVEAPSPKNVAELLSYLGLLNFYGHFIRNLSTLHQPLHKLLQKDVKWDWSKECEETFQRSKPELMAGRVLVSLI